MAKLVNYTATALDEGTTPAGRVFVKVELRNTDDGGNPVTGSDRVFLTVQVAVDGDDGSTKKDYVTKQLNSIPDGKLSAVDKAHLVRISKIIYSAAVKVATNDDV